MRVNWYAVVVSAIVYFLFGALWYGVLFGKAWYAAANMSQQAMPSGGAGIYPFVVSLVMAFFLAYGLARIIEWRGDLNPYRGAFIGFSMALLIFGTMTWMDYAFEMRGVVLGFINVGYVVVGMTVMGAIMGAWPAKPS